MTYLQAAENFLGVDLTSKQVLDRTFLTMSRDDFTKLEIALQEFEASWAPNSLDIKDTLHFGRAFDSIGCPHSAWRPSQQNRLSHILNPSRIALQLVYSRRISVWVPEFTDNWYHRNYHGKNNSTESRLYKALDKLIELRPYIVDGSLTIVPDRYYSELTGWDNKSPGPIQLLSREEAANSNFRKILDRIDFIPDDLGANCSDSRENHTLNNAEFIKYINPINELNEDIMVQATFPSHLACAGMEMFELLKHKYSTESVATRESTWQSAGLFLPKIHGTSASDLYHIRQNEDAFELLRTSVSDFIRRWEIANQAGTLRQSDATEIFNEATAPIRFVLESKIKSKTLKANLESAGVSFAAGAIAAVSLSLDPATSLATGAASTSLKLIYDLLKSRNSEVDRRLLRLYSTFSGII